MKAAIFHEFGPPEVLKYEDVPDPEAGPGEIVVKVHAVTVNRTLDAAVRRGVETRRNVKPPLVLGVDPAGVVATVGEGVKKPKVGEKVCLLSRVPCLNCETCDAGDYINCGHPKMLGVACSGGYADYVKAPAACAVPMPNSLSFAEAAAVIRHGPTAHSLMFRLGRLKEGESVLILGASGGLGTMGIQMAKAAGATVIAGAGAPDRVAAALAIGADHAINYSEQDLTDAVRELTGGKGVNQVYDNVANPKIWPAALKSLAREGRLVTAGAHAGPEVTLDCDVLYHNHLTIKGASGSARSDVDATLALATKLRMPIEKIFPLSEAAKSHRLIEETVPPGKIILDPTLG